MLLLHLAFLAAGPLVGSLIGALALREMTREGAGATELRPTELADLRLGWRWVVGEIHGRISGAPVPRARLACEAVGLGVVVWAWVAAAPSLFALSCLLGWLLLALGAIDAATRRLPNPLTLSVAVLGAVMVALTRPGAWLDHALGGAVGFGVLIVLEILYRRVRGREGLGRGDAKLLGALGIWTGWLALPSLLVVASFAAIAFTIVSTRIARASLSPTVSIAFGPWIALAGWIVWLYGPLLAHPGGL